jgi:hypothetical protein
MISIQNALPVRDESHGRRQEFIDGWLLTVIEVLNFFWAKRPIWPKKVVGRFEVVARGLSSEDM